jgi:AAA ATPase domain
MDVASNPFRPGAGTRPPELVGRDALLTAFDNALGRARSCRPGKSQFVVGLRGVGKTVLLNEFQRRAERSGASVAYLEATEEGSFRSLLASKLRGLLLRKSAGGVAKRAYTTALQALKSFAWTLPDGTTIQVGVEAMPGLADSGVLADDLTDLLVTLGEAFKEDGSALVIVIDELQYLNEDELGSIIMAVHRTNQLDLPVLVVGAGLPQLPAMAGEARSYAERLFDFPELGALTPIEARAALDAPAREAGAVFSDEALTAIFGRSLGYPYFLQEWGYHVWGSAATQRIDLADVEAAAPVVRQQLDNNFFRVRLDRLTPKEREYMAAMAVLGPGPHRSGDVATQLGVQVQSIAPRRSALIKKGMIYSPSHGDTAFTVPMFDEFMRRQET